METLQTQIDTLYSKIDSLQHVIEQLSLSLTQMLSETAIASSHGLSKPAFSNGSGKYASFGYRQAEGLDHKDVLLDDGHGDPSTHNGDKVLSPEIQVQRLTAQLTAAYNRIAALEEQLLAQRIH